MKRLEEMGYRAALSMDLLNSASVTATPRGLQPDGFSNRFAAVAAGLASIAVNGRPVTRELGQRQRFIAVVTDAPLAESPVVDIGTLLCEQCGKACVSTCPSRALSAEPVSFECGGVGFSFNRIDNRLCDWTKRYALQGESGFRYAGSDTDIDPQGTVAEEKLSDALKRLDSIKKLRPVVAEPCLINCPYGNTGMDQQGVFSQGAALMPNQIT